MKKIIMFFFFGALASAAIPNIATAQDLLESQVPQAVKSAFKAKYNDAYVYEWDYERRSKEYEAEFAVDGIKFEAYFKADGQWLRTERDVNKVQVPTAVFEAVRTSQYATWEIDDIEEHSTPTHKLIYRVEVESTIKEKYLYITPDGKIVEVKNKK